MPERIFHRYRTLSISDHYCFSQFIIFNIGSSKATLLDFDPFEIMEVKNPSLNVTKYFQKYSETSEAWGTGQLSMFGDEDNHRRLY